MVLGPRRKVFILKFKKLAGEKRYTLRRTGTNCKEIRNPGILLVTEKLKGAGNNFKVQNKPFENVSLTVARLCSNLLGDLYNFEQWHWCARSSNL
ncbi:hypothetical protein ACROYT_G030848 [Oculina patagonica]